MPAGEEPPEPQPAKARPAAGKHARPEAEPTETETETTEPGEPTETETTEPAETEPEPADALPTEPLPSVPSAGSDADGWLPFAASDEPESDRDRAAGRAAMIVTAAAIALCAVGGLLSFLTGSGDEGAPPAVAAARTSAPAPASPEPSPSRGPAAVVSAAPTGTTPRATPPPPNTETPGAARPTVSRPADPVRTRDRAPLTTREVFGSDRITVQGREYRIVYTDGSTDCAAGARGETAAELRRSGCTQLIRALAVDRAGRVAVTVGVANLPDAAGAGRVVAAARGRGGFTAMWNGRDRRGGGDGYRETGTAGRFVVYGIGTGDGAVTQAVADLRAVAAGRVRARG